MENSSEKSDLQLETQSLAVLMRRYALPCVISLLTAALYNIVDQIFIANASYLGSAGNAANTVVFPLTVIALGFAVMIGDGCCSFVSLCLGSGDRQKAGRAVGGSVTVSVIVGLVITAVYLIFADRLLTLFGGTVNARTFGFAKEYFFWITTGIPFYVFGQAMNPVIRSDGSPRFAMVSTLAGAAANCVLDPLFIFGFKWGMMGAAVATVIGQIITAVMAVWYLCHMKAVRLERESFIVRFAVLRRVLSLGLTSFLAQISLVAAMAAIQNMVLRYGSADPVFGLEEYAQIPMAVLGIVMKFFQIVISIVIGMAAGCIPIAGYNIGAGRNDRVRRLFAMILACESAVGACALIIAEVFPKALIMLFGAAGESSWYTDFAVKSFRIYLCMIIPACINKAAFIFLQSMGKGLESAALSMMREIVFGVGFALLLPRFMGLDGVLWSMPVSDVLTFAASAVVVIHTFRALKNVSPAKQARAPQTLRAVQADTDAAV